MHASAHRRKVLPSPEHVQRFTTLKRVEDDEPRLFGDSGIEDCERESRVDGGKHIWSHEAFKVGFGICHAQRQCEIGVEYCSEGRQQR